MAMNGVTTDAGVLMNTLPAEMLATGTLVRSRRSVLGLLDSILTQDLPFTIRFMNANCTVTSKLIFIDEESSMLLFDCPPEWEMLLKAPPDSIMVGCVLPDAKIEFQGGSCVKVDLDGTPVVGMAIPEFLWRFQRRNDPRERVSGLKITLNMGFLEAEAELMDLSLSGIGLVNCERGLKLTQGELLRNCAIAVPGVGRIAVNLMVQHVGETRLADGSQALRAGCKFVGLRDSARQMIATYLKALAEG